MIRSSGDPFHFFRINCELSLNIIVNCFCSTNFAREEALRFSRRYYSVYEFCRYGVKIKVFFCKTLCYAPSIYQHIFLDSTIFLTSTFDLKLFELSFDPIGYDFLIHFVFSKTLSIFSTVQVPPFSEMRTFYNGLFSGTLNECYQNKTYPLNPKWHSNNRKLWKQKEKHSTQNLAPHTLFKP